MAACSTMRPRSSSLLCAGPHSHHWAVCGGWQRLGGPTPDRSVMLDLRKHGMARSSVCIRRLHLWTRSPAALTCLPFRDTDASPACCLHLMPAAGAPSHAACMCICLRLCSAAFSCSLWLLQVHLAVPCGCTFPLTGLTAARGTHAPAAAHEPVALLPACHSAAFHRTRMCAYLVCHGTSLLAFVAAAGVSHLLEYMAFKSTQHRSHFRLVREVRHGWVLVTRGQYVDCSYLV